MQIFSENEISQGTILRNMQKIAYLIHVLCGLQDMCTSVTSSLDLSGKLNKGRSLDMHVAIPVIPERRLH